MARERQSNYNLVAAAQRHDKPNPVPLLLRADSICGVRLAPVGFALTKRLRAARHLDLSLTTQVVPRLRHPKADRKTVQLPLFHREREEKVPPRRWLQRLPKRVIHHGLEIECRWELVAQISSKLKRSQNEIAPTPYKDRSPHAVCCPCFYRLAPRLFQFDAPRPVSDLPSTS